MTPTLASRPALVAALRSHLQRHGFPRATAFLLLLAAGLFAFLVSLIALRIGIHSMAARYGLATFSGYLSFILLIRVWIAIRRHGAEAVNVDPRSADASRRHGFG